MKSFNEIQTFFGLIMSNGVIKVDLKKQMDLKQRKLYSVD